jgi:hypothetical protein
MVEADSTNRHADSAPPPPPDPDINKYHHIYVRLREQAERITPRGAHMPALCAYTLEGVLRPLAEIWRERPVLLVTACLSCGQARRWLDGLVGLRTRYHQDLATVLLYTLEAHPEGSNSPYTEGEWISAKNKAANIHCAQPRTLAQRIALARELVRLGGSFDCLVDDMGNSCWQALGGAPNMGLLIDRQGLVLEKQGWFHPPEMEKAILALLRSSPPP